MNGVLYTSPVRSYIELIIETLKLIQVVQIEKFFNKDM